MRRTALGLIHTLKDQVRGVRYSLRAEAKQPGSVLPKVIRDSDFGSLITKGAAMGAPALRLADGLFTQVEHIATGIFAESLAPDAFPFPADDLFGDVDIARRIYRPLKSLALRNGVNDLLVSEHALDQAAGRIRTGFNNTAPSGGITAWQRPQLVQVCAGLACALHDAKPIRKIIFPEGGAVRPHFMLSPNLFCALVVGLSIALLSLHPELEDDPDTILDSANCTVDARFDRFKRAATSKMPIEELAREFEAILPFLP